VICIGCPPPIGRSRFGAACRSRSAAKLTADQVLSARGNVGADPPPTPHGWSGKECPRAHEQAFAYFGGHTREHLYDRPRIPESRQAIAPPVDRDITIEEYAKRWLRQIASELKPRTVQSYGQQLKLHILPAFGHFQIRALHRGHIKAVLISATPMRACS
jgi:hypothetical protein